MFKCIFSRNLLFFSSVDKRYSDPLWWKEHCTVIEEYDGVSFTLHHLVSMTNGLRVEAAYISRVQFNLYIELIKQQVSTRIVSKWCHPAETLSKIFGITML